jgi:hypothetical protein
MARTGKPKRASAIVARNRIRNIATSKRTKEKGLKATKKLPSRKTKKRETRKPLKKFKYFMNLPAELRIMIWEMTETPYEHVHIHAIRAFPRQDPSFKFKTFNLDKRFPCLGEHHPPPRSDAGIYRPSRGGVFLSTTAPPIHPLLHACFESRDSLIRKHKLVYAFGAFINPSLDILFPEALQATSNVSYRGYIAIESFVQLLHQVKIIGKIKKLAIDVRHDILTRRDTWTSMFAWLMKRCLSSLKKLYMVHCVSQTTCLDPQRRQGWELPWLPHQHMFFGVYPVVPVPTNLHWQWVAPWSYGCHRDSEHCWYNAAPSNGPHILFEHVARSESRQLPTKNHGVWSAQDYAEALWLQYQGLSLQALRFRTCCNKSINEHD